MRETHKPAVSVGMGIYYRRQDLSLLVRSLDSLLAQSFADFELLICDDGSNPDALHLIEQYAGRDERVCLIRPGNCYSLPEKLNRCLERANGRYFARMDDDDYAELGRIGKQVAFLQNYPDVAFVGSNVNLFRDGKVIGERTLPAEPTVKDFLMSPPFVHPSLVFRTEILQQMRGYSEEESCRLCEDYDLLMRMYAAGYCGCNLQENLLTYSLPQKGKRNRTMSDRRHECLTRWRGFRAMGLLPEAFPYVMKPIIMGLLPVSLVEKLKGY